MDHDLEQEITRKAEAAEERISQIVKGEIATHNQHEESDDEELQEDAKAIDVKARASAAVHPFPMPVQQGAKGGKPARTGGQARVSVEDEAEVIELNDKREKLDKPKLFQLINYAFTGRKIPAIPPASHYFGALSDKDGNRQMMEIIWENDKKTHGIVKVISTDAIEHIISQYIALKLAAQKNYADMACYKNADVVEIRNLIKMNAVGYCRESIPLVLEKSEKGICFHRLPFDIPRPDWLKDLGDDKGKRLVAVTSKIAEGEFGNTPVFDELTSRMTNADAVKAFIGSLLDPHANRAQALFMYGEGGNGKGRLIKALGRLFEGAHTASNTTAAKSQFFMADIVNAKLLTFGECDDHKFPMSDLMKGITGDDRHTINIKNQPQFMADIRCRVVYASNIVPRVKRNASNMRRVIYTEISPIPKDVEPIAEHIYDEMLWAEADRWLAKCWAYYVALCPKGGAIPQDKNAIIKLVETSEDTYQEIMDLYFCFDEEKVFGVQKVQVEQLFKLKGIGQGVAHGFLEFVKDKYGIENEKQKRYHRDGKSSVVKARWGLCIKKEHLTGVEVGDVMPSAEYYRGEKSSRWQSKMEEFYPVGMGV